ncbi:MAG TPA: hypothetical protein VNV60_08770 [Holophagaceae bacterium]|jgi:hypothetical protein|nr:hypothetical protein [Holophagaceae bacterium]
MRRLLHTLLACAFLALSSGVFPVPAQLARACCGMDMGEGCSCPPPTMPEAPCQWLMPRPVLAQAAEIQTDGASVSFPWPAHAAAHGFEPGAPKAESPGGAPDPQRRQALLRCWRT